ncbi:MFS transporter [Granulicella arctica]|uniref:ACS family hexuronate transporter-like MFS transporter n=1 Tax=Granulicella arctica TaxID=940613 RepID=A0A7Y9PJ93_9BACT|nr:MFS transporter [Granulicella arctica]NYF80774.1 ACS family hexuronate transporter-like MFS transporter [Granulicella arctica]
MIHRHRALIVTIFALSLSVTALDRNLLAAVWPILQAQLHVTNAQYGTIVAGFSIAYGVCAPVSGLLVDRFGFTRVAVIALALWSAFGIATAFALNFHALIACRILLGCAESASLPAVAKVYATYLSPPERSMGTAATQIALTIGAVSATLLAGGLTTKYGWQSTFLVAGILGLLWIPLWLWMSATPRNEAQVLLSQSAERGIKRLLREPGLWALVIASLLLMPLYSLWTNWTTVYLVRERGLSTTAANLHFAWIPPILAMLGGISGGWFAMQAARKGTPVQNARFNVCFWAALGLLLTATIPVLPGAGWATAAIGMSFFCTLCISINIYAMALDLFGTSHASFVFSLLTASYGLMQTVISPLIGSWVDHHSFDAVCFLGALSPLCGIAILYGAIFRRVEPEHTPV